VIVCLEAAAYSLLLHLFGFLFVSFFLRSDGRTLGGLHPELPPETLLEGVSRTVESSRSFLRIKFSLATCHDRERTRQSRRDGIVSPVSQPSSFCEEFRIVYQIWCLMRKGEKRRKLQQYSFLKRERDIWYHFPVRKDFHAMADSVTEILGTIGNTPLVEISGKLNRGNARILAKTEYFNPGGSVKDRVALAMIEDAERSGTLKPGATIIEPTSGNTGVGLALVSAARGYRLVLTMPETMSEERRRLAGAYGAEIVLTPGAAGMKGAIDKADELHASIPGSVMLQQFENPANPDCHYRTTGPEIWAATGGEIAAFVAGAGTGGTITGAGKFLKGKNPSILVAAVEPDTSAVLSGGKPGPHGIQGIGAGFVPGVLDVSVLDEVIRVSTEDAYATARAAAAEEGILVGISSGAALWAALEMSKRPEFAGKTVVTLLPDTGERYLSTRLFG
jgi:cysteine synthase A